MKNRNFILQAAVAASLLSTLGLAQAGTVTAGSINYAVEAVGASTNLTLGNVAYALGVARTNTQPFTLIYTLTGASSPVFNATPAIPTVTSVGVGSTCAIAGSSVKRGGAGSNQVVYDIVVSSAAGTPGCVATDLITLTAPIIRSATSTVGITVQLLDTGETACVDNVGTPATCIVASTPRAALLAASGFGAAGGLVAPPADTGTIIDVNAATPLAGFVAQTTAVLNDKDTTTTAKAVVAITNTVTGVKQPAAPATDFTLAATDLVSLTLTDVTGFLGLLANNLCYDVNATAAADGVTGLCTAGEVFTVSGNTATLVSIPGTSTGFNGVGQTLSYQADGVLQLGTTRTIGLAGSVTPTFSGGATRAFTGNSTFWQWSSNGTSLQSTLMQTNPGYFIRVALSNTGNTAANYSAVVRTEAGNTCTPGVGATGTIPANGMLVVETDTICTAFTAGQGARGTAIFTISAPSTSIQGIQQLFNKANGGISNNQLVRPGTN